MSANNVWKRSKIENIVRQKMLSKPSRGLNTCLHLDDCKLNFQYGPLTGLDDRLKIWAYNWAFRKVLDFSLLCLVKSLIHLPAQMQSPLTRWEIRVSYILHMYIRILMFCFREDGLLNTHSVSIKFLLSYHSWVLFYCQVAADRLRFFFTVFYSIYPLIKEYDAYDDNNYGIMRSWRLSKAKRCLFLILPWLWCITSIFFFFAELISI